MMARVSELHDLSDLRQYVNQSICELNELEVDAFELTERILIRRGQPCGMYFCLHGPRSVKLTAIWETDRNSLLFYGSNGERQAKIQLTQALNLLPAAV
jgi:hypothetical protein